MNKLRSSILRACEIENIGILRVSGEELYPYFGAAFKAPCGSFMLIANDMTDNEEVATLLHEYVHFQVSIEKSILSLDYNNMEYQEDEDMVDNITNTILSHLGILDNKFVPTVYEHAVAILHRLQCP